MTLFVSFLVATVSLFGCAAMLVPATSDPNLKLRDAYSLFDRNNRPLPAERLIREAIEIYEARNDDLGLAEAYRAYGFFFRSRSVSVSYKSGEFLEQGATYARRYDKSIEYFDKAASIFETHHMHDRLSNIYLHMGSTYELAKQAPKACDEYGKALRSHARYLQEHPGATIETPQDYGSFEEFVNARRERLGCSN